MTLPDYARAVQAGDSYPPDIFVPPGPPVVTAVTPTVGYIMNENAGNQLMHVELSGSNLRNAVLIVFCQAGAPNTWGIGYYVGGKFVCDRNAFGPGNDLDGVGVCMGQNPYNDVMSNILPWTLTTPALEPPTATLDSLAPATAPASGGLVTVTGTGTNFDATRPLYVLVSPTGDIADGIQTAVTVVDATHIRFQLKPGSGTVHVRVPRPGAVPDAADYLPFVWT